MASFTVSRCWQLQRVDWPLVYTSPPSVVGYRHYLAHGVGVQNVYTIVQCRRYLITGCWLVCLSSLSLDEGICVHIHCFVIAYTSSIRVQHQHLVCRLGMMWGHTICTGKTLHHHKLTLWSSQHQLFSMSLHQFLCICWIFPMIFSSIFSNVCCVHTYVAPKTL